MSVLRVQGRIGVDLDRTLALFKDGTAGDEYKPGEIGAPIPEMVERVKKWIANGFEVVIFTARVHPAHAEDAALSRMAIQDWCRRVFGVPLEVTCMKDPAMRQFWDDRAVTVEPNTGRIQTWGMDVLDDLDYEPDAKSILIQNCARCGGEHTIVFRKLRRACESWTHWGTCPETGEPVMMEIEKEEADALGSLLGE